MCSVTLGWHQQHVSVWLNEILVNINILVCYIGVLDAVKTIIAAELKTLVSILEIIQLQVLLLEKENKNDVGITHLSR